MSVYIHQDSQIGLRSFKWDIPLCTGSGLRVEWPHLLNTCMWRSVSGKREDWCGTLLCSFSSNSSSPALPLPPSPLPLPSLSHPPLSPPSLPSSPSPPALLLPEALYHQQGCEASKGHHWCRRSNNESTTPVGREGVSRHTGEADVYMGIKARVYVIRCLEVGCHKRGLGERVS